MGMKKIASVLIVAVMLASCITHITQKAHSIYSLNNCFYLGVDKGDTLLMRASETNYDKKTDNIKDTTWAVYRGINPLSIFVYNSDYLFVKTSNRYYIYEICGCSLTRLYIGAENGNFNSFCEMHEVPVEARPNW